MASWSGDRESFPTHVRRAILKKDPVCVLCGQAPSTIADHEPHYVALLRAGVPDPHHPRYGQGVCEPCHAVKTKQEQQEGRNRWKRVPEAHPGLG